MNPGTSTSASPSLIPRNAAPKSRDEIDIRRQSCLPLRTHRYNQGPRCMSGGLIRMCGSRVCHHSSLFRQHPRRGTTSSRNDFQSTRCDSNVRTTRPPMILAPRCGGGIPPSGSRTAGASQKTTLCVRRLRNAHCQAAIAPRPKPPLANERWARRRAYERSNQHVTRKPLPRWTRWQSLFAGRS